MSDCQQASVERPGGWGVLLPRRRARQHRPSPDPDPAVSPLKTPTADDTTDACIRYNTVTNKWEGGIAAMPHGVNHAAAATDGKRMFVAGGRDGRNTVGNGFNYLQVRRIVGRL